MAFIHHTNAWIKGEIFEATLFGVFGLLITLSAVFFWKWGTTANAKAVVIPFAVVGLFFVATAIATTLSNKERLAKYQEAFRQDPKAFVQSEKKRVEGFQYLYQMTLVIATVSFSVALAFFFFTNNQVLQAIGLALVLFGLTGLVIDYFSKERATAYAQTISAYLEGTAPS